jgi:hypothetical protein
LIRESHEFLKSLKVLFVAKCKNEFRRRTQHEKNGERYSEFRNRAGKLFASVKTISVLGSQEGKPSDA